MTAMSKAAQMRTMKQRGLTTGEVARLFGVDYHYAYQVCIVRAAARPRSAPSADPAAADPAALTAEDVAAMSWPQLFAVIATEPPPGVIESKTAKRNRFLATKEADDRDDRASSASSSSPKWPSRFETWKKVKST